ncbi:MAG: ACT domain-containing protein [Xanthomonadales bacterium]|nr:ACT domain-containing protein [Xanthomonadales bacterium]
MHGRRSNPTAPTPPDAALCGSPVPVSDLQVLLRDMAPQRQPGRWRFVAAPSDGDLGACRPLAVFREPEGTTWLVDDHDARRLGVEDAPAHAWIMLGVYSDLQAVGLTAAVSSALAEAGIACNVVAALHHDHLFVPEADAGRALECLRRLGDDRR